MKHAPTCVTTLRRLASSVLLPAQRCGSAEDRGRVAWILTSVLLFYTHITGCLIVVTECVFLILPKRRTNVQIGAAGRWLLDVFIISAAYAMAIPLLKVLAERRFNWLAFVRVPRLTDIMTMFAWIPYGLVPLVTIALLALA